MTGLSEKEKHSSGFKAEELKLLALLNVRVWWELDPIQSQHKKDADLL